MIAAARVGYYLVRSDSLTVYAAHVVAPERDLDPVLWIYRRPAREQAGREWPHDFRWEPVNTLTSYRLDSAGEVEAAPGEFRVGWRPRLFDYDANWIMARATTSFEQAYEASLLELDIPPR